MDNCKIINKNFIVIQGIPGSGKTTLARELVSGKTDCIRVNRDDIRKMLGDYWVPSREKLVTKIEYSIMYESMLKGYTIIQDNTNLNSKTFHVYENLVELINSTTNYRYEIKKNLVNTELKTCIERDSKRDAPIGAIVITSFYNKYINK